VITYPSTLVIDQQGEIQIRRQRGHRVGRTGTHTETGTTDAIKGWAALSGFAANRAIWVFGQGYRLPLHRQGIE
jgi:hypothetical protein